MYIIIIKAIHNNNKTTKRVKTILSMNFNNIRANHATHISSTINGIGFNAAKFMEWTNDDALELIEQYRSHTELWNRADPKYKDKLCRFRAWSEIAERFGCSKAEVERKMNVLLTQYRREKHKMFVKLYQGIQPNPSKWYAFKRFDFMEAGGGSSASLLISAPAITSISGSSTNGHQVTTAAAAALNGLTASFDTSSRVASITGGISSHRRVKSKELKYFGAMGLNLPMLLANSQTMDSWSSAGQFSPPISDRPKTTSTTTNKDAVTTSGLRIQLPTQSTYAASATNPHELSLGTQSLFGSSSNNSDPTASPQKPMDTADHEDNRREAATRDRTQSPASTNLMQDSSKITNLEVAAVADRRDADTDVASSSPLSYINTNAAHLQSHAATLRHSPYHALHISAHPPLTQPHDQEDLDIKQELVDYFQVNAPNTSAESQRSFSSVDELRVSAEDYAQDLRVATGKALETGSFVLPHTLRPPRSSPTDYFEDKYTPLNMRKLDVASNASLAAETAAGNVLMNSLLLNESMSEDNTNNSSGRLKRSSSQEAAAAATIYAESLSNRDACDFVGSNVTLKLRAMDRTQRIIAEKLISEVLFYGQFNELERSAHIQPK